MTFPLKDDPKTVLLAWTTTPWSLPGNFWLAVGPHIEYAKVKCDGLTYVLAKKLVEKVFKGKEYEITGEIAAADLKDKHYEPLFHYFYDTVIPSTTGKKAATYGDKVFKVICNESVEVSDEEGTGIVHLTSCTGEDSYAVAKAEGVDVLPHINLDGTFIPAVTDFVGMNAKPEGKDPMSTDKAIIDNLKKRKRAFSSFTINHSYPHCWRCDTPLLPFVTASWFVAVEKIKADMLASNAQTHWVPEHLRDGRFGKWLDGARDWAISRNRYWGTPLPIWRNSVTGKTEVIGSRDELVAKAPGRFTKLITVRHAESQGNIDKIYQGAVPGSELTATGKEQASALAASIAAAAKNGVAVGAVYSSPLARTLATAKAVADKLGLDVVIDDRLREVEFGEYEGKHIDFDNLTFVRERRAHKMSSNQVESIYHFQGMETWEKIEKRAKAFLDDVLPKHRGQTVVVVTHADVMMNFTHLFTGEDKHKIVHQPYPGLGKSRIFFWDHETGAQMDLHKEFVDEIVWQDDKAKTKKSTVSLSVVRHGETDFNKNGLLQGSEANEPLNETGRSQAKDLAKELKGAKFDVIISSELLRANQTAEILAKELGVPHISGWNELNERYAGEWSGKKVKELLKKHPNAIPHAATLTFHHETPPGGESFNAFIARVQRGCDRLSREYAGKKVLVVSHGGTTRAFNYVISKLPYEKILGMDPPKNGSMSTYTLHPMMRRTTEVLDCWFESGSMPYAQEHYPFDAPDSELPPNFPADFIAEGIDQTRGWFYTLTVLSSALFQMPAFHHCVVNGTVLAEDGKKMSKKLKNYPEPTEIANKYGADAVRYALMGSPAVRAEDLRFSEKLVAENLRSVLLPLWNAYRLFVTYANGAGWKPTLDFSLRNARSENLMDKWIIARTQGLINRMTEELEAYDLSATCGHLTDSIDGLTNWYVRMNRRRFAGKEEGQQEAFDTLYRVLIAHCQLLAPFCPFITEAMYLNLVEEEHGSVHFTNWPESRELSEEEKKIMTLMQNTQTIVGLGLYLRSEAKVRVRWPLQSVTFALPPSDTVGVLRDIIKEELNVKDVAEIKDASNLATRTVSVDARKVGPRLGGKVQEVIKAGKAGQFEEKDGMIIIMGETLTPEEAKITFQSKEGLNVAADKGVVVSLDTDITDELKLEGDAREIVRAIQQMRKDAGLEFTDTINLSLGGADDVLAVHKDLILEETRSVLADNKGKGEEIDLDGRKVLIQFERLIP